MLQKATIREAEGGGSVGFQYNPETLSFTKAAKFKEEETQSSQGAPIRQFIGTQPIQMTLKLILDDVVPPTSGQSASGSVAERVNKLLEWTNPADDTDSPKPKDLLFEWGQLKIGTEGQFPCHCKSVKVDYSLFKGDGTPLRATATVTLVGMPSRQYGQNPTSGGVHARRTRRLQQGDDLAAIAHQEYGRQSAWRQLADVNGIDNPFRLPVGAELLLPDRSELRSMN